LIGIKRVKAIQKSNNKKHALDLARKRVGATTVVPAVAE